MSILLIIGGLMSLSITAVIYYIYQNFFSGCAQILSGTVIEITKNEYVTKDICEHINDITEVDEPLIEFCYSGKTYRFKANVDAHAKSLVIGSTVNIVINEQKYPRVAKLAEEASTYQILMTVCGLLGSIFLIIGLSLLKWNTFLSSLDLFTLSWLIGAVLAVLFMVRKAVMLSKTMPLFPENMTEVNDKSY